MSHFGAGLREDISKVILGAANPPDSVADMLTAAEAVEAETSKVGPPGASALAVAPLDIPEETYEETLLFTHHLQLHRTTTHLTSRPSINAS